MRDGGPLLRSSSRVSTVPSKTCSPDQRTPVYLLWSSAYVQLHSSCIFVG